jgi:transporter family protein
MDFALNGDAAKFFQKKFYSAEWGCTWMKRWLLFTLAAIACWGVYGMAFGIAASSLTPLTAQLITSAGLLAPVLFLIPSVLRESSRRRGLWIGLASGACGAIGNLALLAALRTGKTAIIVPLTALYPLVTVIVAITFMGERARPLQLAGTVPAIIAVVLLSVERTSSLTMVAFAPWLFYALASLLCFGFAAVLQKLATNHVSAETAFAMFAAGFIPLSLAILLFEPWPSNLPLTAVLWAAVGGLLNGLGVLATLAAYRRGGKAAVVTPLAALYPVVTILLSVVFLGGFVDNAAQVAGIIAAIVGGILLSCE